MSILILTGKFGMGHYSAAKAIEEEFHKKAPYFNVEIIDIYEYLTPYISEGIYKIFDGFVKRGAKLYNKLNIISEKAPITPFRHIFASKMEKLIEREDVEIIISTLPMCSQYVSTYNSLYKKKIPLFTYMTDISIHNEWIAKNTTLYFVSTPETKKALINRGIKENIIKVCGIPVKNEFKEKSVSNTKKKKELLIMGGGLGLIPLSDTSYDILNTNKNIHTTIITGKNEKLYKHLKEHYKNLEVIGYTHKVSEYMKNADCVVTKAGGITIFEAIYAKTPLLIINPFLEQEVINAKYIHSRKMGKILNNKKTLAKDIIKIMDNDDILNEYANNIENFKNSIVKESIVDEVRRYIYTNAFLYDEVGAI